MIPPSAEDCLGRPGDQREPLLADLLPDDILPTDALKELPPVLSETLIADESPIGVRLRSGERLDPRDKAAYLPAATVAWNPYPGIRLWIGGSVAADDLAVCKFLGIKAKLCVAGTAGRDGYNVRPFEDQGIVELQPWSVNYELGNSRSREGQGSEDSPELIIRDSAWHLADWCQRLFTYLVHHKNVLVYCRWGANRSAAAVVAVMTWATRCAPQEVIGCESIHRKSVTRWKSCKF